MFVVLAAETSCSTKSDPGVRGITIILLVAYNTDSCSCASMKCVEAFSVTIALKGGILQECLPRIPAQGGTSVLVIRDKTVQRAGPLWNLKPSDCVISHFHANAKVAEGKEMIVGRFHLMLVEPSIDCPGLEYCLVLPQLGAVTEGSLKSKKKKKKKFQTRNYNFKN